jgi:putative hydrolase of the HAD superfamily
LYPRFKRAEGSLDWYSVDYWSGELGLDIAGLKAEVEHLIAVHPDVIGFLEATRRARKQLTLVTNAHDKSLALKLRKTRLGPHLDSVICSHDLGHPKEHPGFWPELQRRQPFDPLRTLLVDDSLPVLRAARQYGIAHLLAVRQPDSQRPEKDVGEFIAIRSFAEILPG